MLWAHGQNPRPPPRRPAGLYIPCPLSLTAGRRSPPQRPAARSELLAADPHGGLPQAVERVARVLLGGSALRGGCFQFIIIIKILIKRLQSMAVPFALRVK